jgi:hypothetical protein
MKLLRQAWVCQDWWWVGGWSVRHFEIDMGLVSPTFSLLPEASRLPSAIAIAIAIGACLAH